MEKRRSRLHSVPVSNPPDAHEAAREAGGQAAHMYMQGAAREQVNQLASEAIQTRVQSEVAETASCAGGPEAGHAHVAQPIASILIAGDVRPAPLRGL